MSENVCFGNKHNQWRSHREVKGGQSAPLTAKNLPKVRKKSEKIGKKKKAKIG